MIDKKLSEHITETLTEIASEYTTTVPEEQIKMNTEEHEIKRGTEIKNGKDGLIYDLTFLKDIVTLYFTYILDWSSWIENKELKSEIVNALMSHNDKESEEEATEFKNMEFEEGLLIDTFSTLLIQINFIINMLETGGSLNLFQYYLTLVSRSLQKINTIVKYFHEVAWRDPDFNLEAMDFYEGVITDSVYMGFDFIKKLVESLKAVDNKWLDTKAD